MKTPTVMHLPEKRVNVAHLRARLDQLTDNEIDFIVRAVNAHEELLALVKEWVNHRRPVKDVVPGSYMDRALKVIAKAEGQ